MARNQEKAQSMLFRFREAQAAERGLVNTSQERRPRAVFSVKSVPNAEKWRAQVVREVSRRVTKIQDPSLSDYQLRDINDDINRLMKEKFLWESQIRNLGGPNYMRGGSQFDLEGRELPGNRGYKYFGRARELPGVKELLDDAVVKPVEVKNRAEKQPYVDAQYYGYLDGEEEEALTEYERGQEEIAVANTLKSNTGEPPKDWVQIPRIESIPDRNEVEAWLLERRKQKLLDQFVS